MPTQHIVTLLGATCCVRLATLLLHVCDISGVVGWNLTSFERSQHFNAKYRNIVGCNMLRAFGYPVATCCDMLGVVGSNLKMVKFFMQHLWMLHDVDAWSWCSASPVSASCPSRMLMQMNDEVEKEKGRVCLKVVLDKFMVSGPPLYGQYRYVQPQRVWSSSRFGHK